MNVCAINSSVRGRCFCHLSFQSVSPEYIIYCVWRFFLKGDFNFSLNVISIPLPRFDMFSSFTVATKQASIFYRRSSSAMNYFLSKSLRSKNAQFHEKIMHVKQYTCSQNRVILYGFMRQASCVCRPWVINIYVSFYITQLYHYDLSTRLNSYRLQLHITPTQTYKWFQNAFACPLTGLQRFI